MANFTDLFRRRENFIAIVEMGKGVHFLVNDSRQTPHPNKPTWNRFGPYVPGHIYAVAQIFVDLGSSTKNDYIVDGVKDLTAAGWTKWECRNKSRALYEQAQSSKLKAFDDPLFLLECVAFGFITQQDMERRLAALKVQDQPLTEERSASTLRF